MEVVKSRCVYMMKYCGMNGENQKRVIEKMTKSVDRGADHIRSGDGRLEQLTPFPYD